jgi:hypothetical protein
MASTTETRFDVEEAVVGEPGGEGWTSAQSGSICFPEVVRAHYNWERSQTEPELERAYRRKLEEFQSLEGELRYVYWATRRPSAVALTVKRRGRILSFLLDNDTVIRLHRATDWLARERRIADLMHHCDTLAIKASEVLRGTSERIAMQWIYTVESHALGFVERTQGRASEKEIAALVDSQQQELIQIERYYARAGEKAGRIIYFWGMMAGVFVDGLVAVALAGVLWSTGWFAHRHAQGMEDFFICYVSGGLGAIVSVLMRMSSNNFRVDYEVGRSTIRRLGSFRPFIGAIFGVAVYFLIRSGIPRVQLPASEAQALFFFAVVAFLAGFNERWTNVLFGQAERTIAASLGGSQTQGIGDDNEQD